MWTRLLIVLLLSLLAAALGDSGPANATTFNPSSSVTVTNPTPSANSDVSIAFAIPTGESLTDLLFLFIPPQLGFAADASVPGGARVGNMSAALKLSVLNGACNTSTNVNFTLLDATTSPASQTTYAEGFNDANADGLHDAVTKYPDYLTRIFPALTPRARMYGDVNISGIPRAVNILVFQPGTDLSGYSIDAAFGYPAVVVIDNLNDPQRIAEPELVSDTCSPMSATVSALGLTADNPDTGANEAGVPYLTNPPASGAYAFTVFVVSEADADSDNIENSIDSCPFVANAGSDSDGDGVDNACDPGSNPFDSDQDNDGYSNRQDNCPLAVNGQSGGQNNQADADLDRIGDTCDPTPAITSGHKHSQCNVSAVAIGASAPVTPIDPLSLNPCRSALPANRDGDAFTDVVETACGSNPTSAASVPERTDRPGDDDADGQTNEPLPASAAPYDCDGDRFAGNVEAFLGTNPQAFCAADTTQNNESPDAWPTDNNDDRLTGLADVQRYIQVFNTSAPGPPYDSRFDLNANNFITLTDVQMFIPVFNVPCSP